MKILLPAFILLIPFSSYAYLDPGTGSYILQVAIGALAGGILVIKTYWVNIKIFISKYKKPTKKNVDKNNEK